MLPQIILVSFKLLSKVSLTALQTFIAWHMGQIYSKVHTAVSNKCCPPKTRNKDVGMLRHVDFLHQTNDRHVVHHKMHQNHQDYQDDSDESCEPGSSGAQFAQGVSSFSDSSGFFLPSLPSFISKNIRG